jgi:4-aminobutyrate--pyruvate transaminase
MRSNSLSDADITSVLHPYTNARLHEQNGPVVIVGGDGIYVTDDSGNRYIEALAGLWSVAVGFNEPRLVKAASDQLQMLPYYHSFIHKANEPAVRLAEKLVSMAPENSGLSKVFFTNSGSEANDTVVKLVWYMNNALGRPEKKKFLARHRGYHGVTVASGSLTGLPVTQTAFDVPAIPVRHLTCPHHYRFGLEGESEEDFAARLVAEAEAVILEEGADTIAAFIGEPLMGAGGVLPPPVGYWQGIEALCRKHDILLVADEVINGFGRLGTMFGCQRYDFTPDIMVLSKQLTSSYIPMAAVLISDRVYQPIADQSAEIGVLGHGFTGSGHPVAAAVALENLAIIEERGLVGNAARLGPLLQQQLRKFAEHELVGEVRGEGLIGAVEMVADKTAKTPFFPQGKVGAFAFGAGHRHGIIVRAIGDSLALCPPLIVTEEDIAEIVRRLERVLDETLEWTRMQGLK